MPMDNLNQIPLPRVGQKRDKKSAKEMLEKALKDCKSSQETKKSSTEPAENVQSSQSIVDELFKDYIAEKMHKKDKEKSEYKDKKSSSVEEMSKILDLEMKSMGVTSDCSRSQSSDSVRDDGSHKHSKKHKKSKSHKSSKSSSTRSKKDHTSHEKDSGEKNHRDFFSSKISLSSLTNQPLTSSYSDNHLLPGLSSKPSVVCSVPKDTNSSKETNVSVTAGGDSPHHLPKKDNLISSQPVALVEQSIQFSSQDNLSVQSATVSSKPSLPMSKESRQSDLPNEDQVQPASSAPDVKKIDESVSMRPIVTSMLPAPLAKKVGPIQLGLKLSEQSVSLIQSKHRIDRDGRIWEEGELKSSSSGSNEEDSENDGFPSETGSIDSNAEDWRTQTTSKHKKKHKHKHKKKKKKSKDKDDTKSKNLSDPTEKKLDANSEKGTKDSSNNRDDRLDSKSQDWVKDKQSKSSSNDTDKKGEDSVKSKDKKTESERSSSSKRNDDRRRKRSRTRSRSPKRRKHSRSKSRSPRSSKRSSDRNTGTKKYDDGSSKTKRGRSRSRSRSPRSHRKYSRHSAHLRDKDRDKDRQSREKEKDKSRKTDKEVKDSNLIIDKTKLRKIAIANALQNMKSGQGPQVADVVKIKAGGKSVEELTDFCKKISEKEKVARESDVSESSEGEAGGPSEEEETLIHHPFKVKDASSIVMNIRNSRQLPVLTPSEKQAQQATLRLTFPVSSGSHHRATESEWVPVKKTTAPPTSTKNTATTSKATVVSQPPKKADNVFAEQDEASKLDIGSIISERLQAVRKLQENPYDVQALTKMHRVQEQASKWASSRHLPGQFSGSTGVQVLSQQELIGDRKCQAWAKKDQLTQAAPVTGGIGMFLLQKMGWKHGEGLGKNNEGNKEPLMLDVKTDRKGLQAYVEAPKGRPGGGRPNPAQAVRAKDLSNKHPVSALMELCNRRRWGPPMFTVVNESGPDHKKHFLFKVRVNNVEYQPSMPSSNKKLAKAQCAGICLQEMGLLPRDAPLNI